MKKVKNIEPKFRFGILVSPNFSTHTLQLFCTRPEMEGVLREFVQYFNTIEKIENAEKTIENPKLQGHSLGANDHTILVKSETAEFDFYFKDSLFFKDYYPLVLTISQFKSFLQAAKDTLAQYESCQLPGLLPNSKFDTWTIVENNDVNESYFEERNSKLGQLINKLEYDEEKIIIELLIKYPLLESDLRDILMTNVLDSNIGKRAVIKSLNEFIDRRGYSGYELKGRVNTNLIRIKIEDLELYQ